MEMKLLRSSMASSVMVGLSKYSLRKRFSRSFPSVLSITPLMRVQKMLLYSESSIRLQRTVELRWNPWKKQYSSYSQENAISILLLKSLKMYATKADFDMMENLAPNVDMILVRSSRTPSLIAAFSELIIL